MISSRSTSDGALRLAAHVTPKSPRDEVRGWRGTELDVRVSAPPESGKANEAVCALIATALGVPKSAVDVIRGQGAHHKKLAIKGVCAEDIRAVFGEPEL